MSDRDVRQAQIVVMRDGVEYVNVVPVKLVTEYSEPVTVFTEQHPMPLGIMVEPSRCTGITVQQVKRDGPVVNLSTFNVDGNECYLHLNADRQQYTAFVDADEALDVDVWRRI